MTSNVSATADLQPISAPQDISSFICQSAHHQSSGFQDDRFFRVFEGKRYCVFHYPGSDKAVEFASALVRKIDNLNYDFRGVYFPGETLLISRLFASKADFSHATFLGKVDFTNTHFFQVDFSKTKFCGEAIFKNTIFEPGAFFHRTQFLWDVSFEGATFKTIALFYQAHFKGRVHFSYTKFGTLNLRSAIVEKAEQVVFRGTKLRAPWLLDIDARKFEIADFEVFERVSDSQLKAEFEEVSRLDNGSRSLANAYRNLALNAEEKHRYRQASEFRYAAMQIDRFRSPKIHPSVTWKQFPQLELQLERLRKQKGWAIWTLDFWYWALSGYGERVLKATLALLAIILLCAIPYWFVGFSESKSDPIGKPLRGITPLIYSLETAILQKPEPRPVTNAAKVLVGFETILAPIQAALLALAIRRKYMR